MPTNDNTIIPRTVNAIELIKEAIGLESKLNPNTIQYQPGVIYILLKNNKSDRDGLAIWYNGFDGLISGGRSVEAGRPYYYTTFGELKNAITEGVKYRESLN